MNLSIIKANSFRNLEGQVHSPINAPLGATFLRDILASDKLVYILTAVLLGCVASCKTHWLTAVLQQLHIDNRRCWRQPSGLMTAAVTLDDRPNTSPVSSRHGAKRHGSLYSFKRDYLSFSQR